MVTKCYYTLHSVKLPEVGLSHMIVYDGLSVVGNPLPKRHAEIILQWLKTITEEELSVIEEELLSSRCQDQGGEY